MMVFDMVRLGSHQIVGGVDECTTITFSHWGACSVFAVPPRKRGQKPCKVTGGHLLCTVAIVDWFIARLLILGTFSIRLGTAGGYSSEYGNSQVERKTMEHSETTVTQTPIKPRYKFESYK